MAKIHYGVNPDILKYASLLVLLCDVIFLPHSFRAKKNPSLSGTPTVTFWSVHIHNVVAKKRDASTDLLWRLHGYMKQHNVDFIWERLQHECLLHSW